MKSWKARLLILATMLAMLIALAAPASADHDDWEDVAEFCAEISNTWEEFEECIEWFEDRDEEGASSGDTGSGDTGSGDAGSGYDYWQPYYWDPDWLYY